MAIEKIGAILEKLLEQAAKKRGPNSPRALAIEDLCRFMGEHIPQKGERPESTVKRYNRRFKYWLGRTRKLSPQKIYELMSRSKEGKNPPALLNWQLKNQKNVSK